MANDHGPGGTTMSVCKAGHGGADDICGRTEEKAKPGKEEDAAHETRAPTPTSIGRVMEANKLLQEVMRGAATSERPPLAVTPEILAA